MIYSSDFYINRLVKEWLTHEKIIIACDLDDTLFPYNEECTDTCLEVLRVLKFCTEVGYHLILNTAREDVKFEDTIQFVKRLGLDPISINKMPDFFKLPIGRSGKVYANIFLDDRAGLQQALTQLETAAKKVKEVREQIKIQDQL